MKTEDIEGLVRPNIRAMVPYSTARDDFKGSLGIFLDANESPYPTGWNRYPDPHQKALKQRLSEIKGVPAESIFIGNGSDEAIDLVYRIFCVPGKDNAVAIAPSYGMYSVSAAINDVRIREVVLNEDFSLPVERILAACDSMTKVIFLCSPNNPTGNAFPKERILEVVDGFGGIVVVDEAYADFSDGGSLVGEIPSRPNMVILQTCSKARAMAALRVGIAIADPYVIGVMSNVKYPYNISESSQRAAMEALSRDVAVDIAEIKSERARVAAALERCACAKEVHPSDANFLLVEVDDADAMYGFLTGRGIIVRNRTRMPLCKGCLRVTIGLEHENDELIKAFQEYEEGTVH